LLLFLCSEKKNDCGIKGGEEEDRDE